MLFCSAPFFLFFVTVFAVYWAMPWQRPRVYLLLAASIYFYAKWNKQLALLICVSTTIDFFLARSIEDSKSPRLRRLLLLVNIVANLGLLCYFKYANFFLESFYQACGWPLPPPDAQGHVPLLHILLPVGISFYTFEAINYMVDVYRGHARAERNLPNFMLFILFFPHLVAGPIVRARDFLPQIHRRKHFSWLRMQTGVQFFLMGLFKKLAIADRMAQFADPVFKNPEAFRSGAVWTAVIAYALQIYCDFSGYTDMALGCAHMLGYKLARNFNLPYLARNIAEFWHRWHISLSTWLRDYLFIPLGGSRGTTWKVCRNLMITMTLGGLWHGASWTFVVWGVLHGGLLVAHRGVRHLCRSRPRLDAVLSSLPGTLAGTALTFLCVALGWVFFRATTFGVAAEVLKRLFVLHAGQGPTLPSVGVWYTVLVVALCHFVAARGWWKWWEVRLPAPVLGFGYSAVLTLALVLAPATGKTFIYFQF
jgi:alginate O-acetyltransferase complex protein AlgI